MFSVYPDGTSTVFSLTVVARSSTVYLSKELGSILLGNTFRLDLDYC